MAKITIEDDDTLFEVSVKNKGSLFVDGFELTGAAEELGLDANASPSVKQIADLVRKVAWSENIEDIDALGDLALFAVGSKVMVRMDELGKERGWLQSLQPPTESSSPSAA
jgi:hypothetical protein